MTHFILFPDVVLVEGALNSLLIDFRARNYIALNKEILQFLLPRTILLSTLNEDDKAFVDYLAEREYGLFCSEEETKMFEQINENWDFPAEISNAIVEIDEAEKMDLNAVFKQLSDLQCEYVELRLNTTIPNEKLIEIVKMMGANGIHGIQLVMPFHESIHKSFITTVNEEANVFIYKVLLYNTPAGFKGEEEHKGVVRFQYVNRPLTCLDCGNITASNFIVDIGFYAESKQYNTCLNRKLSITSTGEIKNCPSFTKSYGNIADLSLRNVLKDKKFTDLWIIDKDQIKVCQDCEFRRICTDCRAYRENEADLYSKPLKCNYNPYSGEWEEK